MKESIASIIEWSQQTFPGATLDGQIDKYQEEYDEWVQSNRRDVSEWADLFIVACSICRFDAMEGFEHLHHVFLEYLKSKFLWDDLCNAIDEKMKINRSRNWAKLDGQYRHKES